MKNLTQYGFLLFLLLTFRPSCAQEFQLKENGLVYDQQVMSKLHHIVDSLNLKFKKCDSYPYYKTMSQARIHVVRMGQNKGQAIKLMKEGKTLQEIQSLFPSAEVDHNKYLLRSGYSTDKDSGERFRAIDPDGGTFRSFKTSHHKFPESMEAGAWLYSNASHGLTAFYLLDKLESHRLPQKYALMIGYVDCMVDTTSRIFKEIVKPEGRQTRLKKSEMKFYGTGFTQSRDKALLESMLKKDAAMRKELKRSAEKALQGGYSTELFESLTEQFVSKEISLSLKRSRRVFGMCSQDQRPRLHALEIARLSAETTNWSVFLRSHLDIMNDNFSRATDGSYAEPGRSTYIKELESLDIAVKDLLLGISFRIDEPSENHYYGHNRRTARAIAESSDPEFYLQEIYRAIEDPELDLYNRLCMTYLALNCLQQRNTKKKDMIPAARKAISTLPEFVKAKLLSYLD